MRFVLKHQSPCFVSLTSSIPILFPERYSRCFASRARTGRAVGLSNGGAVRPGGEGPGPLQQHGHGRGSRGVRLGLFMNRRNVVVGFALLSRDDRYGDCRLGSERPRSRAYVCRDGDE